MRPALARMQASNRRSRWLWIWPTRWSEVVSRPTSGNVKRASKKRWWSTGASTAGTNQEPWSTHSLCGSLGVERWTYREVGLRNGPTLVPLELDAGLVETATPALGYSLTLGYSKGPLRSYREDIEAAGREVPSRSTLERIAKDIGTAGREATPRIEPVLRRSEGIPTGAWSVTLGLDRTTVPMEELRAPEAPPTTRRKLRKKPRVRKAPKPVDVRYRMAYVGTISVNDLYGEMLVCRRYAVGAHEDPRNLTKRLMADLRNILRRAPDLIVAVVQDGAPELWSLMRDALLEEPLVHRWHEAIDRFHLSERLSDVLHHVLADQTSRAQKRQVWEKLLDEDDTAIERIEAEIEAWWSTADSSTREKLEEHLTYLQNRDLMRYARHRGLGLPTGSGVTEGACKSLIAARAKRSGQRWRREGLEAVLALRSLYVSDRLPRFWAHFLKRYRGEVLAA